MTLLFLLVTFAVTAQEPETVEIGSQVWMKYNLNVGERIKGSTPQSNNKVVEKYCLMDLESNCTAFGGLYQWNELMNYQSSPSGGICPEGFRVPTNSDMEALIANTRGAETETYLTSDYKNNYHNESGVKLKHDVWYNLKKNNGYDPISKNKIEATNSSGFSALPAGYAYFGAYENGRWLAWYWTADMMKMADFEVTKDKASYPVALQLQRYNNGAVVKPQYKEAGFSVRCIKK